MAEGYFLAAMEVPGSFSRRSRWKKKDTSVLGEGEMFLRALVPARERSASSEFRLGILRAPQPSSATCEREQ